MNRLSKETSPYLRQHMDNPVDWYPWGSKAFLAAVERDRPILLSVGYSSCHWCHVMAHESFENVDTAKMMNQLFVNIKVDREERPDIDTIYMESVQAMTGRGGWPMTVFLTPDGRPFFGGTYYPHQPHQQMPSFRQVMTAVDEAWTDRRPEIEKQADSLTAVIRQTAHTMDTIDIADNKPPRKQTTSDTTSGQELLRQASHNIVAAFDLEWGGFGIAPKFPGAMTLDAALRIYDKIGHSALLEGVCISLDGMASGGIWDHIGGGFARYSVDRQWLVPHFEKMLYDNALLARTYLHAWQATGNSAYRQILDETIDYVLRDLRLSAGGFCSAEDADSEGVEGRYYVWSKSEIENVVGAAVGKTAAKEAVEWWAVTTEGNFEGKNILHRPLGSELMRPTIVDQARAALFEHRRKRVRPGLDNKVLTEWNALMLATLCEAAAATRTPEWHDAAVANGEFLLSCSRRSDGRWLRSWQPGHKENSPTGNENSKEAARHLAYAHDYAALVDAFTRLAELTGKATWINEARKCADSLITLFADQSFPGFFTTGKDAEKLITRPKDIFDNATPSAQSSAATGLLRLARLSGNSSYSSHADAIVKRLTEVSVTHPTTFGRMLEAVDMTAGGLDEVVIVGDRPDLVEAVQVLYSPNTVLAWGEPYKSPLWHSRKEGYAYVCRNFSCQTPTADVEELRKQLNTCFD
ncbi:MAG: thioredoxin domain-containing protein [Acidimicrobiaceae bacterium]|nr:thioredoxin domain-containing protein [Acidimicrobiaceae bacterium]